MKKVSALIIAAILILQTQTGSQTTEGYISNNLGRIVEVATPNGVLSRSHVLIKWDTSGFVRQGNSTNQYKFFRFNPSQANLNGS